MLDLIQFLQHTPTSVYEVIDLTFLSLMYREGLFHG